MLASAGSGVGEGVCMSGIVTGDLADEEGGMSMFAFVVSIDKGR